MPNINIQWPEWKEIINDRFIPLIDNRDRYLILWGGRGSSKSDMIAKKLIYRCLTEKYFRYVLVRRVYNTIKESSWQTIKDTVEALGLDKYFHFVQNPLGIRCINGNRFIAAGCDDPKKLKSLKDPTGVWYEEDIIDLSDWITITTTIRTMKADYLQEVFTLNPEVEGEYRENWFFKKFFAHTYPEKLSYDGLTEVTFEHFGVLETVYLNYTVHHSTYMDNVWLPKEFLAFLEDLKNTDPYYYQIYCLGLWGNRTDEGKFYKAFKPAKHQTKISYTPALPLHLTWDFNTFPYVTLTLWQVYYRDDDFYSFREVFREADKKNNGKKIKTVAVQVDEILGREPYNSPDLMIYAEEEDNEFETLEMRYKNHVAGIGIYGDPDAVETGVFKIIQRRLGQIGWHGRLRLFQVAPMVVTRGQFLNAILGTAFANVCFMFNERCPETYKDYAHGKEAEDGRKLKERVKDEATGIRYEKYHHITDANDYFLCRLFRAEFNAYIRGGKRQKRQIFHDPGKGVFKRR